MLVQLRKIYQGYLPHCRKPDEPLLVEIDDEWVVGGDEHVQPQVGLVTVDQQRIVDILAHN